MFISGANVVIYFGIKCYIMLMGGVNLVKVRGLLNLLSTDYTDYHRLLFAKINVLCF